MLRSALIATFLLCASGAQASIVKSALSGAELRGTATFRFVGFPLYEARLYTKGGAPLDWSSDFGLELNYMRNLTAHDLVESTMRELRRTGGALPLRAEFERCYRDVRDGDQYAAVSQGPDQVQFWYNGTKVCSIKYPEIKTRFMAIFLGENTRSRAFTRKLKGE